MYFEAFIAICIGIGLSASCGFRVFVPLLIVGGAARADLLTLAEGFDWMSSWPALIAFGSATALEVGAYYFPWLDNLLDTISSPAAVIAGILTTAACIAQMDPLLQWSVAIIAGGGAAAAVKAGAVGVRVISTAVTGGMANAVVSTGEVVASVTLAVLTLVAPILGAALAVVLILILARFAWRVVSRCFRRPTEKEQAKQAA